VDYDLDLKWQSGRDSWCCRKVTIILVCVRRECGMFKSNPVEGA
jgi:hypothetical protein